MHRGWFFGVLTFVAAVQCFSQGTVNFANGAAGVDAPITNSLGPFFSVPAQVQLYVGPAGITDMSLLTTNGVSGTPATLGTGSSAGYFFGGARDIEGYAPGTIVTLQVRAWATSTGSSWESASPYFRNESNLIQVSLGGGAIPNPNMVGLQGFSIFIPEPSSFTLAALALMLTLVLGVARHSRPV